MNINTAKYWDERFASGDWEACHGSDQTKAYAQGQLQRMGLPKEFDGTVVDFGCGLGDAIPLYRERFPRASLVGVDISPSAVKECRRRYGRSAKFIVGGLESVPKADVIVASHVLEHLDEPVAAAQTLLERCRRLFIAVPYREAPLYVEHVHSFDRHSFDALGEVSANVFAFPSSTQHGRELWVDIYLKNVVRLLLGRPLRHRRKQVLFELCL